MSTEPPGDSIENLSREELMSALFANMVFQNTNMTLMLLGRVPHPETGEKVTDLDAARMFIDQLEMLAVKTKGNLSKDEDRLLQQSLTHVRLAFVEAVQSPSPAKSEVTQPAPQSPPGATPSPESSPVLETPAPEPDAESRKRFTKKY
ncbi:MAG TPA: DUF1844 domain-containing protein [Candidatus Acidoferrum sp.]|nr:DUF1844 domain-containing protein [Candidatus Acidoferrum sp.]